MTKQIIRQLIILLFIVNSNNFSFSQNIKNKIEKLEVTYIANAGFMIEIGGQKVIIDGLFNTGWGNYLITTKSVVSDIINQRDPFNKSNLMLITHNHGDHFNAEMIVKYLINSSENILIAPPGVVNELLKYPDNKKFKNQIVHLDKIKQEKNDTTIKGIKVRSFFIQHDSRPQIENVGYLIKIGKLKIFIPEIITVLRELSLKSCNCRKKIV